MNAFPFLANAAEAVGAPATSWDVPGIIFLKLLAVVFLVPRRSELPNRTKRLFNYV
jgi:hypothetical protein